MSEVSVLGLGSMGGAIAHRLITTGRQLTVWNRSQPRTVPLAEVGADVAVTAADAITASPVSICIVNDYEAIMDWLAPIDLGGRTLLNVTTGTPAQAERLNEVVRARRGRFVDLALFFYPDSVGAPSSSLRASGSRSAWLEYEALIASLAGDAVFVGEEVAQANMLDTVWISFYVPALTAAMEAMSYALRNGLDPGDVASVLKTALPVAHEFLADAAARISSGELTSANPVELYRASLDIVRTTTKQDGGRATMADAACSVMESIAMEPRTRFDFSALPSLLSTGPMSSE